MLDAYSVRKAIPRVLVAVIAINLSIYLCVAMLDITMIIGRSMNSLLVTPFLSDDSFKTIEIEANTENSILGVLGTTALLAGIVAVLINGVIASAIAVIGLLMPIILIIGAIIIAVLFTLIVRQGLLVFLTVVSPVAIACYILPGTEKYFKQWLDTFIKTLLIYPIIAVIFAMSNILASILLTSSSSKTAMLITNPASMFDVGTRFAASDSIDTVRIIVAILALYAPLLLIPFAFKLAGGVMGGVMKVANGQANKFGRQGADKFSKMRDKPGGSFARNKENMQLRRQNRGATFDQVKAGAKSAYRRNGYRAGVQGHDDLMRRVAAGEAGKDPKMQQLAFDDEANAVMALSGGTRDGAITAANTLAAAHGWSEEKKNRAIATAAAAGDFNANNAAAALNSMTQNKSRMLVDTRKYDNAGNVVSGRDLSGLAGQRLIEKSASDISGGNTQLRDNMIGNAAYNSRGAGRLDIGNNDPNDTSYGWQSTSTQAHAASHGASMQHYATGALGQLNSTDAGDRHAAATTLLEMQNMLPSATADNQIIINKALADAGIDHDSKLSVSEQLANRANGRGALDPRGTRSGTGAGGVTPGEMSAERLSAQARVYSSDIPLSQRQQPGAPGTPGTP